MRSLTLGADEGTWLDSFETAPRARLLVLVPCPPCERRVLRGLPPVPRRQLRAIVQENTERYFPRTLSPLCTDVMWVRQSERLALAYGLSERLSQTILDSAKRTGREVVDIRPAERTERYSLLPQAEIARRSQRDLRRTAVLVAITLVAVLAGLAFAMGGQRMIRLTAERSQPAPELVRAAKSRLDHALAAWRAESAFVGDHSRNEDLLRLLSTVVGALGEGDELAVLDVVELTVREIGVFTPNPEHVLTALGGALTNLVPARDGPTLGRRDGEVWTHLVLQAGVKSP